MRRRKSKAPKVQKPKPLKLDVEFKCPFCEHDKSVSCTKDNQCDLWVLSCSICDEVYTTPIVDLMAPIDVHSEWVDECARINKNLVKKKTKTDNSKEILTDDASSSVKSKTQ